MAIAVEIAVTDEIVRKRRDDSRIVAASAKEDTTPLESELASDSGFNRKKPPLIRAGAADFLAVLLGVMVIFRNQKGDEVGRMELPPGHTAEVLTAAAKLEVGPKLVSEAVVAKPAAGFNDPEFIQWMEYVASTPAEKQAEAVAKKLQELNPDFDGTVAHKTEEGVVTELVMFTDNITDISPVRALAGLRVLHCPGSSVLSRGKLSDLSPLEGMSLANLDCNLTKVTDLSPLKGMPLTTLSFGRTRISNLAPLQGMPLTILDCSITRVSDLSPLRGMKLTYLNCDCTLVADLSPLQGMPLTEVLCRQTSVSSLSPLAGMPLMALKCDGTLVSDLSPLAECKNLKSLHVAKTKVAYAGVTALQRALPDCKIAPVDPADPKPPAEPIGTFKQRGFNQWTKQVAVALPAEKQVAALVKKLYELNPSFQRFYSPRPKIENGVVTELKIYLDTNSEYDISPVRALPELRLLNFPPTFENGFTSFYSVRRFFDLSPLAGMRLTRLACSWTCVSNLSPLAGMPLMELDCSHTKVTDLSPLMGMQTLGKLDLRGTKVTAGGVAALQKALPNCKIEWSAVGTSIRPN